MHQAFFEELAAERIRELSAEARRQRLAREANAHRQHPLLGKSLMGAGVALFRWGARLADEVDPRPRLVEVRGVDGHVFHR